MATQLYRALDLTSLLALPAILDNEIAKLKKELEYWSSAANQLPNQKVAMEEPWNELAATLSLRALDDPQWDELNEQLQARIRPIIEQINRDSQTTTEEAMSYVLTHLAALEYRRRLTTDELIRRGVLPEAPRTGPNPRS